MPKTFDLLVYQHVMPPSSQSLLKEVKIEVANDHLERLINCHPIEAISELIWNSLDAEAQNVDVTLHRRGGVLLEKISITDDGTGIDHDLIDGSLHFVGGSWKRDQAKSKSGLRILHGKKGARSIQSLFFG